MRATVVPTRFLSAISPLGVLLAHRDISHEALGKAYLRSLTERKTGSLPVELTEWGFDMLGSAALSGAAANEAKNANVVVIATACDEKLPSAVKAWFETWISQHADNSVLVVLLSESEFCSAGSWPDYSYVHDHALRCGRKLLIYLADSDQQAFTYFCPTNARRVLPVGLASVQDFFEEIATAFDPADKGAGDVRS